MAGCDQTDSTGAGPKVFSSRRGPPGQTSSAFSCPARRPRKSASGRSSASPARVKSATKTPASRRCSAKANSAGRAVSSQQSALSPETFSLRTEKASTAEDADVRRVAQEEHRDLPYCKIEHLCISLRISAVSAPPAVKAFPGSIPEGFKSEC